MIGIDPQIKNEMINNLAEVSEEDIKQSNIEPLTLAKLHKHLVYLDMFLLEEKNHESRNLIEVILSYISGKLNSKHVEKIRKELSKITIKINKEYDSHMTKYGKLHHQTYNKENVFAGQEVGKIILNAKTQLETALMEAGITWNKVEKKE